MASISQHKLNLGFRIGLAIWFAILVLGVGLSQVKVECESGQASIFIPQTVFAHESDSDDEVIMHMGVSEYEPKDITIEAGTKVSFENISGEPRWPASNIHPTHEIYSEFDPQGEVLDGDTWSFVFDTPGVWKYHDHIVPSISGTITVTGEAVVDSTPPTNLTEQLQDLYCRIFFASNVKKQSADLAGLVYDDQIPEDTTDLYNGSEVNKNNLYSYVKKFGSAATILHLSELEQEGGKGDCHTAGHEVGRMAYSIEGEEVFRYCTAECHSGCYHGATEAYFKEKGTADLTAALNLICGEGLNGFFNHQCLHGIGHGLMAWTDYELPEALKDCDRLDSGAESCYSGVFMENVVGGLAGTEGHDTEYLKDDDPLYPCNFVDEKYKNACYFFQTSRMVQIFNWDFSKVIESCSSIETEYQSLCFSSMGRDVGSHFRTNMPMSIRTCNQIPTTEYRLECLQGAVQDFFWSADGQDEALEYCGLVEDVDGKTACYQMIYLRSKDVLATNADRDSFCSQIETDYQYICRTNN